MSLVAYNSSDESGESDVEEEPTIKPVKETTTTGPVASTDGHISDEDDFVPVQSNVTLPVSAKVQEDDDGTVSTLLKGLPAPKPSGKEDFDEEELEEEVKAKPTQISDAPKPPPKRTKQPVKISIPKLEDVTEPDEDEPAPKKVKPSPAPQGKSGLFSLLPAPIHAARKETNRILIPHALTKRPQAKKPAQKPTKPKSPTEVKSEGDSGFTKRYTAFSGLTGYDSDSDEESSSSNFFSLDSNKDKSETSFSSVKSNPDVPETSSTQSAPRKDLVTNVTPTHESSIRTVTAVNEAVLPAVQSHIPAVETDTVSPPVDQDAPLFFKPTSSQHNPLSAVSVGARYQYMQGASSTPEDQSSYSLYPEYEEEQQSAVDISQYMQDEQFLRLQGKSKRGKEEINIIDANMDDFVNPIDVAKNITEESSYQSHRKKDNNPTTQQRRKKQITYLAFQAKERELELKNSWAQSRMTKRQTQAKYGF